MKRHLILFGALLFSAISFAQVTSEPEVVEPADSVKIIVDLSMTSNEWFIMDWVALDCTMYIWTWKPAEHPAGHPLENGIGSTAWKNSNPALRMKKEAEGIYSYTLVPTDFYEVDAATVYAEDIHFLIKPKDGGGYGDPDNKTEDLMLAVDPPISIKDPGFIFPNSFNPDDLISVVYEYDREDTTNNRMVWAQEDEDAYGIPKGPLGPDDVYIFAECTTADSSVYFFANNFTVDQFPELKMEYIGEGVYEKLLVPSDFFEPIIPAGSDIAEIRFVIQRRLFWSGSRHRTKKDAAFNFSCD